MTLKELGREWFQVQRELNKLFFEDEELSHAVSPFFEEALARFNQINSSLVEKEECLYQQILSYRRSE